ncbi:hypothetical protein [Parapedobacter sp. 10938]|uniref:hypothetical protein n=1 Tax=Parapedobacter flavus TaxID=3110225 RepID=UPI002DBABBB6|nr:hypothetical protein [Parapedobacter sp. 10938]MEC3879216.1 hypothetical protein [Parapedobacter sp. 10938]
MLLIIVPLWLLACGNNGNGNKADGFDKEETSGEKRDDFSGTEDVEHSEIPDNETEMLAQGINIGIKSITIPEHPRGDYVPFSNCPQDKVSKFEFRVENRGADFDKKGKAIFGAVQIKRLSDGAVLLNEEAVLEFRAFTPGWVRFRFDPIDLSQPGLYEVTVESYMVDLPAYLKDKSVKPKALDTDLSDNKAVYVNRVLDPESLEAKEKHAFDFEGMQSTADLAGQGWNYSCLPDSVHISNEGVGDSKAIEVHLHRGDKNKRKLYTPTVAMPEDAQVDFQFKLLDAQSGKNVTEELMASETFKAAVSLQKICSTGVAVTYKHKVSDAQATEDGFFRFPHVPVHQEPGNYRGQIEFSNLSGYPEILLVVDHVVVQPRK